MIIKLCMIPLQSPFKLQKTLFGAHGVSILVLHMDFSIFIATFSQRIVCALTWDQTHVLFVDH